MPVPKLDFSKNYQLENDQVKISPLKYEHSQLLFKAADNTDVWTYFLEKGKGELFEQYVLEALRKKMEAKEYPFVIYDKIRNQYAGMTRLYAYDESLSIIKIGHTWYGKDFWRTGVNRNCKFLLFQFVFVILGLERVGFGVHSENTNSIYALASIGCTQEGKLRSFLPSVKHHGRSDLLLFSLLKTEWNNGIKDSLLDKINNRDK